MQDISDKIGDNQFGTVHTKCVDCGKKFALHLERISPTEIKIKNGAIGRFKGEYLCKCSSCFEKNKYFGLKTEVYSRVVGYLRPISNWNPSKRDEFKMRKTFKV